MLKSGASSIQKVLNTTLKKILGDKAIYTKIISITYSRDLFNKGHKFKTWLRVTFNKSLAESAIKKPWRKSK